MKVSIRLTLAIAATTLVAACGGGGGGGGGGSGSSSSTITVPSTPVGITTSNAPQVAGASTSTVDAVAGAGSLGGSALGVSISDSGVPRPSLSSLVVAQVAAIAGNAPQLASLATGAVTSATINCSGGGSMGVSFDDADSSTTLTRGDTLAVTLNSCVSQGETLTGSLGVAVQALTGTPGSTAWSTILGLTFNNTTTVSGGLVSSFTGSPTLTYSVAGTTETMDLSSTSSLSGTYAGNSFVLSNFTIHQTQNTATNAYTLSIGGTFASSLMAGSVTMSTPTPLAGNGSAHPSSGVVKLTGAGGSSVTLTALDSTNVTLDIDSNGDGMIDTTQSRTWATLN